MSNPSKPMSYWALHTTHVLVSLIVYLSLLGFTYFSEVMAKTALGGNQIAAVWIVVGSASAYFIANLKVTTQGINLDTQQPTNTQQATP